MFPPRGLVGRNGLPSFRKGRSNGFYTIGAKWGSIEAPFLNVIELQRLFSWLTLLPGHCTQLPTFLSKKDYYSLLFSSWQKNVPGSLNAASLLAEEGSKLWQQEPAASSNLDLATAYAYIDWSKKMLIFTSLLCFSQVVSDVLISKSNVLIPFLLHVISVLQTIQKKIQNDSWVEFCVRVCLCVFLAV